MRAELLIFINILSKKKERKTGTYLGAVLTRFTLAMPLGSTKQVSHNKFLDLSRPASHRFTCPT